MVPGATSRFSFTVLRRVPRSDSSFDSRCRDATPVTVSVPDPVLFSAVLDATVTSQCGRVFQGAESPPQAEDPEESVTPHLVGEPDDDTDTDLTSPTDSTTSDGSTGGHSADTGTVDSR